MKSHHVTVTMAEARPSRARVLAVTQYLWTFLLLMAAFACLEAHAQTEQQEADPHQSEELAAQRQALGFLGYLDQGRFADSYAYTGMLIRTSLDRDTFAQKLESARNGAGALVSRNLIDSSYSNTLPGAPEGQYVVLHYATSFAGRQQAVETVTLAFAKSYWRVSGYFIK